MIWLPGGRKQTREERANIRAAERLYGSVEWVRSVDSFDVPGHYADTPKHASDWVRMCLLCRPGVLYMDADVRLSGRLKLGARFGVERNGGRPHVGVLWSGNHPEIAAEALSLMAVGDKQCHHALGRVLRNPGYADKWEYLARGQFTHKTPVGVTARTTQ